MQKGHYFSFFFASSSSSLQGSSLGTVTLTQDTTTPLAFYPPNRARQLDTLKLATEKPNQWRDR